MFILCILCCIIYKSNSSLFNTTSFTVHFFIQHFVSVYIFLLSRCCFYLLLYLNVCDLVVFRGSVRHATTNAQYLPGVCAEPSLQSTAVDRVQTESIFHSSVGPTREQADMSGPVSGDISHLSDAPGTFNYITISLIYLHPLFS